MIFFYNFIYLSKLILLKKPFYSYFYLLFKQLRLLYSLIIYKIVNFFFLRSLLFANSFFLSISEKCFYTRDCSSISPYAGHVSISTCAGHISISLYAGHVSISTCAGHISISLYAGHVSISLYTGLRFYSCWCVYLSHNRSIPLCTT